MVILIEVSVSAAAALAAVIKLVGVVPGLIAEAVVVAVSVVAVVAVSVVVVVAVSVVAVVAVVAVLKYSTPKLTLFIKISLFHFRLFMANSGNF